MPDSNTKSKGRRFFRGGKGPRPNRPQPQTADGGPVTTANQGSQPSSLRPSGVAPPPLTIAVPENTPRFADLGKDYPIDTTLIKTITEDMRFDHMTPVQAATIFPLLKERRDVLAQAKTGTGKTTAFLLPAIQNLINRKRTPGKDISLLVISPTRELAMQIASEAEALLQRMPQYKVCIAIGGTNKIAEEKRILAGCDILVATPGRLQDHFNGDGDRESSRVLSMVQHLDTLVLDEADRLLDMGFLNDLKAIISSLADKQTSERQGMLFSATIGDHVQKFAHIALSKDYHFISTIPQGELNTHESVPQHLILVPTFSDLAAGLIGALRAEISHVGLESFKTIVFAPTAVLADFYAEILQQQPGIPKILVLHSRMAQNKRSKITEEFRNATSCVLVATDVIARGMDFPGVTNVFQVGIPQDRESYIHRLGRTARAGAGGRGTFIVTMHEKFFPDHILKDIKFSVAPADLSAHDQVMQTAERMDTQAKTYQGWLGFYKTFANQLRWDSETLVREANKFALEGLGAAEVPGLEKRVISKMGLKGVRGLKIAPAQPIEKRNQGRPNR